LVGAGVPVASAGPSAQEASKTARNRKTRFLRTAILRKDQNKMKSILP
jgi:hypothetical protein